MLIVHAYAKVNLTLEVLGKRADGYHQIVSVMQSIDLSDEVSFTPSNQLTLKCSVPSLETDDNLVLRAANRRCGYSFAKTYTNCIGPWRRQQQCRSYSRSPQSIVETGHWG